MEETEFVECWTEVLPSDEGKDLRVIDVGVGESTKALMEGGELSLGWIGTSIGCKRLKTRTFHCSGVISRRFLSVNGSLILLYLRKRSMRSTQPSTGRHLTWHMRWHPWWSWSNRLRVEVKCISGTQNCGGRLCVVWDDLKRINHSPIGRSYLKAVDLTR